MNFNDKGLSGRATGLFALTNFAVFLLYYTFNYLIAAPNDFVVYMIKFTTQAVDILIPLVASLLVTVRVAYVGKKAAFTGAIAYSAVKLIYLIPYHYLHLIYDGYDSIESLVIGLLYSVPELIIFYGIVLLMYWAVALIHRKASAKKESSPALAEELGGRELFDIDNGATLGLFALSLFTFVYLLAIEIINTVSYLIEYAGSYEIGEIIYIAVSFLYDLGMLFLCHVVVMLIKNAVIRRRVTYADSVK